MFCYKTSLSPYYNLNTVDCVIILVFFSFCCAFIKDQTYQMKFLSCALLVVNEVSLSFYRFLYLFGHVEREVCARSGS